jgi:hypothetical protein
MNAVAQKYKLSSCCAMVNLNHMELSASVIDNHLRKGIEVNVRTMKNGSHGKNHASRLLLMIHFHSIVKIYLLFVVGYSKS